MSTTQDKTNAVPVPGIHKGIITWDAYNRMSETGEQCPFFRVPKGWRAEHLTPMGVIGEIGFFFYYKLIPPCTHPLSQT